MRERNPKRRRRAAAAAAVTLALALAWSAGSALAQDDEEDVPLDTKLFRQLMKDLGLQQDGGGIDYRERAPLVVPPSRNLPPPQSEPSLTANPAWPKDPDVQQRKAEAAAKKKKPLKTAGETIEEEGRPLSRQELDRGKVAAGTGNSGSNGPDEDMRWFKDPVAKSTNIFKDMFSTFSSKEEVGTFTGEPVRESLTEPPPGYQTPSPDQPYGLRAKANKRKAMTIEERTAGENR
jgi:hypothetical protein